MQKPSLVTALLVATLVTAPSRAADPPPALDAKPPQFYIEEYILVDPAKIDWFIDYYERKVLPVLQSCPKYRGWMISSYREKAGEKFDAPSGGGENAAWHSLGPPSEVFVPHAGSRYNERERTNSTVHFHAMLKPTYNLIMHHYFADYEGVATLNDCFTSTWKKMYGTSAWDDLADHYFVHVKNHSDTVYRFEIVRGGYDGKPKQGLAGHTTPANWKDAGAGRKR